MRMQNGLRIVGVAFVATVVVFLVGCQSSGPKNFEEALVAVDKIGQIAAEQGVSWYADLEWSGSPNVYQKVQFGLDTGISLKAHMQGNAQAGVTIQRSPAERAKAEADVRSLEE